MRLKKEYWLVCAEVACRDLVLFVVPAQSKWQSMPLKGNSIKDKVWQYLNKENDWWKEGGGVHGVTSLWFLS